MRVSIGVLAAAAALAAGVAWAQEPAERAGALRAEQTRLDGGLLGETRLAVEMAGSPLGEYIFSVAAGQDDGGTPFYHVSTEVRLTVPGQGTKVVRTVADVGLDLTGRAASEEEWLEQGGAKTRLRLATLSISGEDLILGGMATAADPIPGRTVPCVPGALLGAVEEFLAGLVAARGPGAYEFVRYRDAVPESLGLEVLPAPPAGAGPEGTGDAVEVRAGSFVAGVLKPARSIWIGADRKPRQIRFADRATVVRPKVGRPVAPAADQPPPDAPGAPEAKTPRQVVTGYFEALARQERAAALACLDIDRVAQAQLERDPRWASLTDGEKKAGLALLKVRFVDGQLEGARRNATLKLVNAEWFTEEPRGDAQVLVSLRPEFLPSGARRGGSGRFLLEKQTGRWRIVAIE